MAQWPPTEQEERIQGLFMKLDKLFKKANKSKDPDKIHGFMKDISDTLREGKRYGALRFTAGRSCSACDPALTSLLAIPQPGQGVRA